MEKVTDKNSSIDLRFAGQGHAELTNAKKTAIEGQVQDRKKENAKRYSNREFISCEYLELPSDRMLLNENTDVF